MTFTWTKYLENSSSFNRDFSLTIRNELTEIGRPNCLIQGSQLSWIYFVGTELSHWYDPTREANDGRLTTRPPGQSLVDRSHVSCEIGFTVSDYAIWNCQQVTDCQWHADMKSTSVIQLLHIWYSFWTGADSAWESSLGVSHSVDWCDFPIPIFK